MARAPRVQSVQCRPKWPQKWPQLRRLLLSDVHGLTLDKKAPPGQAERGSEPGAPSGAGENLFRDLSTLNPPDHVFEGRHFRPACQPTRDMSFIADLMRRPLTSHPAHTYVLAGNLPGR
jgi:hypothetical protein